MSKDFIGFVGRSQGKSEVWELLRFAEVGFGRNRVDRSEEERFCVFPRGRATPGSRSPARSSQTRTKPCVSLAGTRQNALYGCRVRIVFFLFPTSLEAARNAPLLVVRMVFFLFPTSLEATRNAPLLVGYLTPYGSFDRSFD
ncbi:hypothetical protein DLM76_09535 [Leptospira yasudae]|nr:hypothetical protein DLM76_09535 [Leptospira yasudae]